VFFSGFRPLRALFPAKFPTGGLIWPPKRARSTTANGP
jgi:hypothetical protein